MRQEVESSRIRSLRPAKSAVDPSVPIDVLCEPERSGPDSTTFAVTVFLTGGECPFSCVFCDLWRYTLDEPTPVGALPKQLDMALSNLDVPASASTIKLYNASNFFDNQAVPVQDWRPIADRLDDFDRVTVECHPKLVDERCVEFDAMLRGRLEVAMGLETVHPVALSRLNKGMTLEDFDRASELIVSSGLELRVFALVGAPWVPEPKTVDWVTRTTEYAFDSGARLVSLIAVRSGNGALDALADSGSFTPPTLRVLEAAVERSIELDRGIVQADLWEVEKLKNCPACFERRLDRLQRLNLTGIVEEPVACEHCDGR